MAEVRAATGSDVAAIRDICTRGYRTTYPDLLSPEFIERMLTEFYNAERVTREVTATPPGWLGYQVAEEDGRVVGAAGGGLTAPGVGELFVLYLDPDERGRGLGTLLLDRITDQIRELGATEMWVAALEGNELGIPFYEARGFRPVERRRTYGSTEADNAWSWRFSRGI
ncbi:N-acetyltransferase [Actinoplanes lobatus]|uniref:N-acetyltransferase n=1 Tax=Actinoplanes lobatus TaxID=113568 RepID=A0A7W7HE65_9ACTN|nr:GNAT family N-acetyltransferase [Actinoplanes lobatus]MBB4748874.1 GNAT superfamily N-acetyltransferase [Actinoplanes lobatus]GGN67808.1 N-acetyltransferase [Actinoplanes lobatus]GIE37218.1 N-acetyltransferase [Actinoplanes lobatus]